MKTIIAGLLLLLLAGCASHKIDLSNLTSGMSKQEITSILGKPETAGMGDGFSYLYFKIHDHAFGRDNNRYMFTFKDDRLTGFTPLPEDQQELRLVDAALKKRSLFVIK
jgi:outer membrane protein assembly factor BamE (lipoprotein component of BamABCDE complex)